MNVTIDPIPDRNVQVVNANNVSVSVNNGTNLTVQVTPIASQVIQINRGVAGPSGGTTIAGYPVNCNSLILHDVLMFGANEWVNTNQTEITDGGNF
jgi:uncharacterized protein with LGFP repeats